MLDFLTIKQSLTAHMPLHSGTLVSGGVDPFLGYGKYATDSAYPHADSPLLVRICLQPIPFSHTPYN